jgi:ankyrin repeat protein
MERIKDQLTDAADLAKQVLSWITRAKRPLTTSELQHALAVEAGELEFDKENLTQIEYMISVCAGLVTIDQESRIIRLVHYTTQEYFERTHMIWFPDAEVIVAETCVTYLSFDEFENGFCSTDKDFEARLLLNPLYDYAARNWGYHAQAAPVEVKELVLAFLESGAKISASGQAAMVSRGSPGYSQRVPRQITGLHLAAYFGLAEVVMTLLMNGHKPNLKDSYEQTPLLLAAANGYDVVVSLLLASDGIDVNSEDKHGRTPVSWAAEKGQEAVVKQLLMKDGIDSNSKDRYDQTPLTWAKANGHATVVNLLAAKGHGGSTLKNTSQGPALLSRAAKDGNTTAVQMFLRDIHPNFKDESGRTPLSWAAEKGHEAVVKLLLAADNVDVNLKDEYERMPLSWAAEKGHEAVVKLLLAADNVDANLKDEYERTPLALAVMYGHEAVIKLLLEADGVDLNCKDKHGMTPLVQAVWRANDATVKLLLEHGARSDSMDTFGRTPLWHAACRGHKTIVELLLETDIAEANRQDAHGLTPLLCAAERGHVDVVKLFLERGIKAKLDDNDGKTRLQYAIAIIELLLENDKVEASLKNEYGQILLSQATERGHVAVAKLLLYRGVNGNNMTPHSYGEGVVKLLLDAHNVEANLKDEHGPALLLYAAERGHETVVQPLLEKGAEAGNQGMAGYLDKIDQNEFRKKKKRISICSSTVSHIEFPCNL